MICRIACQASKGTTIDINPQRRAALKFTYPGWEIQHLRASGRWYARRIPYITPAQLVAGVVAGFTCDSYDEFVQKLAAQATLIDQCGGHP